MVVAEDPNQEDFFVCPIVLGDDENQDFDELEDDGMADLLGRVIRTYMTAATTTADTIIVDALDFKASPKYDAR